MTYRKEIDGLRSIAVMAVVLFHFSVPGISGGFVGVDIFFVISGFLIGGILWDEISTHSRLSLSRFYQRRLKRLAPAYVVMCLVTFAIGWLVLLPFEFREFGKGLIAATLYLSNILFFRQTGYFDTASEDKALLHTWSLSVEEQFYIFLPLLMLLLLRHRKTLLVCLCFAFVASLAASIWATSINQPAAFYLFPFRAWELLAGVLLAIWGRETQAKWDIHPLWSWAGIACLGMGILLIQPNATFPGIYALAPVAGTVLILINGGNKNLVNSILSSRPFVAVGLISYSLYLWHWPVVVLSHTYFGEPSNVSETLGWIMLSIVLATISWRYVENPIRHAKSLSPHLIFSSAAIASVTLCALGAALYVKNGVIDRFSDTAQIHIRATQDFLQDWSRCDTANDGPLIGIEICAIGPEGQTPEVLVWGDSHVRAFHEGLDLAAHENGVAGLLIWRAGCPPFFDIQKTESAATPSEDASCTDANARIEHVFNTYDTIERVMLIGRWSYYAEGTGAGNDAHNTINLEPDFGTAFDTTLSALQSHVSDVFILRQTPELPNYDSRDVAQTLAHRRAITADQLTVTESALAERIASSDPQLQSAAQIDTVTLIDPQPILCENGCNAIQNGSGYYFDNNHITNTAALSLRHLFTRFFTGSDE